MTNEFEDIAGQILQAITASKKILLHCHPHADPDSAGSVLAMAGYLKSLAKEVVAIAGDTQLDKSRLLLPNLEWIEPLNYTQIKPEEFDLFLILDSSSLSQITSLSEVIFPSSMKTVVIDHHQTNVKYGQINLVEPGYSSTSEIVYKLLTYWKAEINEDMAICMFMGIYADTGGFKYANTTPETLLAAAQLAKINPNFPPIIFQMENRRTTKEVEFMGLALSCVETYFDNKVAVAAVSFEQLEKKQMKEEDTQVEISSILRSVVGWEVGISFVEVEPGKVYLSFRTRDSEKYDVSKLAKAIGTNGGGHKAAAGTKIFASFVQAKKILLDGILAVYPDLKEVN